MNYSVQDIAQIVYGEILNESLESNNVHSIITDSRIAHIRNNEMFVALVGKNFNAHDFIENVYQKGGRIFLVSQAPIIIHSDASYILVEDTLQALQTLAAYHRQQFEIPVVGITGSNGKTVVKEWLTQLLNQKYTVCKSPKSYNSQVGVPLSVLQMSNEHQLAFFEAGISHPGEMERLANIINPNLGILTNIGDAHQINFSSKKEKLKEKLKLFSKASKLFFLQDNFLTKSLLLEYLPATEVITVGFDKKAFPDIFCQKEEDDLYIEYKGEKYGFKLPFTDEVSVKNLALVVSVIIHQNWLTRQEIAKALAMIEPVSMRMELIKGRNNLTIVNDAYNYDLTGLKHALHFAWKNRQNKPFSIILSDFVQHSENSKENAQAIAALVNNYTVQNLFLVGNELKKFSNLFHAQKNHFFVSADELLNANEFKELAQQTLLIKGARPFKFEKIIRQLQAQTHSTRLEINIEALRHNFQFFKSRLKPTTKIMVMVKAFAYGAGADEVSHLLEGLNADYLGVAYTDEGVKLRNAGVKVPIMVMNPEPETFETLIAHQLEPEIYSFRIFNFFLQALEQARVEVPYPVHLKFDTGMHRLGFEKQDIIQLKKILKENESRVDVKSIFSHLTSSDNPKHDQWTEQQVSLFNEMCKEIVAQLPQKPLLHILNSNGIIRFPHYQMDMVRLGIGLYGIIADNKTADELQNVCSLYTTVSQLKTIAKNETVGYDRSGKPEKDAKIATVAIGYADGLPRILSKSKFTFSIQNQQAPIIGNICMDMTMLDVTNLKNIKEGDEVTVFDSVEKIKEMAKLAQTIPYEILTSIPQRIKRIYIND